MVIIKKKIYLFDNKNVSQSELINFFANYARIQKKRRAKKAETNGSRRADNEPLCIL